MHVLREITVYSHFSCKLRQGSRLLLCLIVLFWVVYSNQAYADNARLVTGQVIAAGQPLAGAQVQLLGANNEVLTSTNTDAQGRFSFQQVPQDTRVLFVSHAGDESVKVTQPRLFSGKPLRISLTPSATELGTVSVQATRYHLPRDEVWPSVGSSVYVFAPENIAELPQGTNTSLQQVLTQAPGVYQDTFGQIHIRGEHANIQYRINGIYMPSQLISGFGSVLSTNFAHSVTLLTGTLPAEYGYQTAGVIDIDTPTGSTKSGVDVSQMVGAHDTYDSTASWGGTNGNLDWFLTGDYYRSNLGVGSPTPAHTPPHDFTHQSSGFGYLSYSFNENSRLLFVSGDLVGNYQIPNTPAQTPAYGYLNYTPSQLTALYPSEDLNENQRESNRFSVLALQGNQADWTYSFAYFNRLLTTNYLPDPVGDLVYQGVAANVYESSFLHGLQIDLSRPLDATNTLSTGLFVMREDATSDNTSSVFPADSQGNQTSTTPLSILDNNSNIGWTYGAYVQDKWQPNDAFTLNYGVRADLWDALSRNGQVSPRIGSVWKITPNTTVHAGYARYFTPPDLYSISLKSIELFQNTTNASPTDVNTSALPQRSDYYDAGLVHDFTPNFSMGVDAFYEQLTDVLDVGQLGSALVFSYFNYSKGRIGGISFSGDYHSGNFGANYNLTYLNSLAKDVITGQYNWDPDELAFVNTHYIPVDHSQKWTGSAGAHYDLGKTQLLADFVYGSGYPTGFANQMWLPSYGTVNVGVDRQFDFSDTGTFNARLSITNLFDRVYQLRNGTGVGLEAPEYLPRRGLYFTLSKHFQ